MPIPEIQKDIETIAQNASLYQEKNFNSRMEAIDFIEFHIIDRIEGLLRNITQLDKLNALKTRAEELKATLEEIDVRLFQKLKAILSREEYPHKVFKNLVTDHIDINLLDDARPGYDNLDIFINGLLSFKPCPGQTKILEPEMVFFQKTPARLVFKLVEHSVFTNEDVFFDLGSGMGQVAILVNLLSGVQAKGVEFEPAFYLYAQDCVKELNLYDVEFINVDARHADYSKGTVFFMFTPFTGEIMKAVLNLLRKEAAQRKIRIITYGPCTAKVALQTWLHCNTKIEDDFYKLTFFTSVQ